jgi:hypothetical protein
MDRQNTNQEGSRTPVRGAEAGSALQRLGVTRDPQIESLLRATDEAQRISQQVQRDESMTRALLFGGIAVATP